MSAAVALSSSPVMAHHSYAMFDDSKELSDLAVVRIWEFSSPHAYLWVYVNDTDGKPVLFGLEAPGPNQLVRAGWDRDTVKPGDKVKVSWHPLRDGRAGGSLSGIVLADGRSMSIDEAPAKVPGSGASGTAGQ